MQLTIVGAQLFSGKYSAETALVLPIRYTDIFDAGIATFQALLLDGWADAMEHTAPDTSTMEAVLYFVAVTLIGWFLVSFTFIAIVLHQFDRQTPRKYVHVNVCSPVSMCVVVSRVCVCACVVCVLRVSCVRVCQ